MRCVENVFSSNRYNRSFFLHDSVHYPCKGYIPILRYIIQPVITLLCFFRKLSLQNYLFFHKWPKED